MRLLVRRLRFTPNLLGEFDSGARGKRFAEKITLRLRAPLSADDRELSICLNAFRGGRHSEATSQRNDRLDDSQSVFARFAILNERSIYLDFVEGKAAKIAQRRIAGAEIVQCDSYSEIFQLP